MAATRPHAHVACRHHGGDRVLVDHLTDGIAQQHHELVERFDRALQLDAVDQVNRHRHALAPQRVQERILQRLPLGHGVPPAWLLLFWLAPSSPDPYPTAATGPMLYDSSGLWGRRA